MLLNCPIVETSALKGKGLDEVVEEAIKVAKSTKGKPTAVIAKSVKGKGVSFMENEASWHGAAPNKEQYEQAVSELDAHLKELEVR